MATNGQHQGKVAIVTGGAAGMGLAIARVLAAQGARVAVGARRLSDAAAAHAAVNAIGHDVHAAPLDVTDPASLTAFMAGVRERLGTPAILVNCAGIMISQTVSGHSDADWQATIDTNLTGPFRMTRASLPAMIAAGWGRIVNIASTAATTAMPDSAAYCASKAGLLGLTRATALEGAPHGVTAVAVSPTWVETPMLHASAEEMAAASGRTVAEEVVGLATTNPQNRLVQTGEIAQLVSFLCSDLAPGLTMEDIQINAGAHW